MRPLIVGKGEEVINRTNRELARQDRQSLAFLFSNQKFVENAYTGIHQTDNIQILLPFRSSIDDFPEESVYDIVLKVENRFVQ